MTQSKGKCTFMKILFHFIFMDIYVGVLGCKYFLQWVSVKQNKQNKNHLKATMLKMEKISRKKMS